MNLKLHHMREIEPMTDNQQEVFKSWDDGNNLVLSGSAGSGKTFCALYLALEEVLGDNVSQNKVLICRSAVPTKEIGFLPGTLEEKMEAYTIPYKQICSNLFEDPLAYPKLVSQDKVEFVSTSHIRGLTFDDTILIVDEMQNLNFHELDSIITRVGNNCRVILCGDYYQSDLVKNSDREGILQFMQILEHLNRFTITEFTWSDIVRSDFVRDYIMTKEMLMKGNKK